MGGIGRFLGDAFGQVAKDAAETFGRIFSDESGVYGFRASGDALLKRTPEGTAWGKYLKDVYEPNVSKTAQRMLNNLNPNLTPAQRTIKLHQIGTDAVNLNRAIFFGANDEALVKAIAVMKKNHGKVYADAVKDMMNVYMHEAESFWTRKQVVMQPGVRLSLKDVGVDPANQYVAPKAFENALRRSMSWMYTPTVGIAHIAQIPNIFFQEGFVSASKALSEWTGSLVRTGRPDKAFQDIIDSGALFHEFIVEAINDAKTPGASLASQLFNAPLFNWVRRQEITMAALAAKNHLMSAAREMANGVDFKWNEAELQRLGVNTRDLAQRGYRVSRDDLLQAMHHGANQSIFIHRGLMTPWKWDENFGMRIISWYKHFSFQQTKFIKDGFKQAYQYGGPSEILKKAAILGLMFPAAGEFVRQLENVATGRGLDNPLAPDEKGDTHYGDAYFNAIAHAAGWGIFHTMFRSGMRSYMYGLGYLQGPALHTLEDLTIVPAWHIKKGIEYSMDDEDEKANRQYRAAARVFVNKFGIPGRIASELLLKEPPKDSI